MKLRIFIFVGLIIFASSQWAGMAEANEEPSETLRSDEKKPNILWLSVEDIGPQLSCYGDDTAPTPNLDALAKRGMVYDMAWSNYPVCAPARTTIITGMYAAANGAGNMRSIAQLPRGVKMFPQYLREAGYYCTNNSKEDYNHAKPKGVWDQSNRQASWRNREVESQPFFAVYNHTGTHESKIRKRPHKAITDPTSVQLTPYWPDTPEVRQDWAQYYDNFIRMDEWIGRQLKEVKEAGEEDNTIVVFFGDHGSGMPRHKRYAGDSGMRVPMVVYVPEKLQKDYAPKIYKAGGRTNQPFGFIDLAPSMLSVAGIKAPDYMQGKAVMGQLQTATETDKYLFGFRDRMDERPDFSRSLRDEQYLYVRNYLPHLPAGQWLEYQQQTPATRTWYEMFNDGKLNEVQSQFWKARASEELYDLKADPHETKNLVGTPGFEEKIEEFRSALKAHTMKVRDLGFVHEGRLQEITAKGEQTRRDFAMGSDYSLARIFEAASAVGGVRISDEWVGLASDSDATVRYWAAVGLLNTSKEVVTDQRGLLAKLLDDEAPEVAMTAAETLIRFGADEDTVAKARSLVVKHCDMANCNHYYALMALNIVERYRSAFEAEMETVMKVPTEAPSIRRGGDYVKRMILNLKDATK